MYIDIKKLRKAIRDYYGTAAASGFPAAFVDLAKVEAMSDEEIVVLAKELKIDLRKFVIRD